MLFQSYFSKIPVTLRPVVILGGFALLAFIILKNPPSAGRDVDRSPPSVEVATQLLKAVSYRVVLDSYGIVRPRTQSILLPQVSGQIVALNPNFREGGFFEAGEVLVTIDDRDFKAAVTAAEAAFLLAESQLLQERAQAQIAERDWVRSGNKQLAPDLVLRKPQLKAAQANLRSAEAELQTARLNLDRTRIRAPYAGRVLTKSVDLGQAVSNGTALGEIYATDYVEIRLPLKNQDLAFIQLPESYRVDDSRGAQQAAGVTATTLPQVMVQSELIGRQQWPGQIIRTEGAIDNASQQLHVIAQIEDPYGLASLDKSPLKIGQYVTAKITGRPIENALVITNSAIYQGTYVYVVEEGTVQRRNITIAWQNSAEAIISSGLTPGEQLVVTPLGQVISGTRATVNNNSLASGD